jgi:hypothetical protein
LIRDSRWRIYLQLANLADSAWGNDGTSNENVGGAARVVARYALRRPQSRGSGRRQRRSAAALEAERAAVFARMLDAPADRR